MSMFDAFVERFHAHFTQNPNSRVTLGVNRDLGELPDPSLAAIARRDDEAAELLEEIAGVPRDELSFDQRLDLDLAALMLESERYNDRYTFNGRTQAQQLPSCGDDVGGGIFLMLINDPRPAAERLEDITSRLEKVSGYVEALLGRLDTPVARWVSMDVQKVEGLPQLFDTVEAMATEEAWPELPRLTRARAEAEQALTSYVERLKKLPTTTQLHVGEKIAREIVRLRGIDKSLEEIHSIAKSFLADTQGELASLRTRLVQKHGLPADTTMDQLEHFLAEKHPVQLKDGKLESVLDRYQQERRKILAFIHERDLFPVFEDQDMRIVRTPSFLEPSIPAGAMVQPAPFRDGTKRSLVYLTLSEELLAEHTELSIPNMMIHEGIPGHHLQLATAATHPSVVRRHVEAMDHAEGWTTMLEGYMLDVGYMGELTDEARFTGKRDIARIGARVGIDLFFMTGDKGYLDLGVDCDVTSDDPFVSAGKLLAEVTGFVPGRVQAELNWYSQERGYPLSYLTGNRLVLELKRDLAAANAGKLEGLELDRRFHALYMGSGNMPLANLRRVFEHEGLVECASA
ncbi:MAG: DUF885 domain-containing protein [Deltaproteobacteria bacterium]|nr:DUF885 domain-containing protein [Deltaproteobacteria bacterium]